MTSSTKKTFDPLAPSVFEAYHRSFKGDTYDACRTCGGKCEKYTICTLMPGEKEFLAARLGMGIEEMEERFLDGIDTPYGTVDVIKMKDNCPWLDDLFSCSIREIKPVLCDTYPIVCSVEDDSLSFDIDAAGCPIANMPGYEDVVKRFREEGIRALEAIPAPARWWRTVELYDAFDFDYPGIETGLRATAGYQRFRVEEILGFACLGGEAEARKTGLGLLERRIIFAREESSSLLSSPREAPDPHAGRLIEAYGSLIREKAEIAKAIVAAARNDPDVFIDDDPGAYLRYVKRALFLVEGMAEMAASLAAQVGAFMSIGRGG